MPNTARHVDDEPPAPYQATFNDVLIESFRRIGGNRVLTNKPEELTEAQPTFGPSEGGLSMRFIAVSFGQVLPAATNCGECLIGIEAGMHSPFLLDCTWRANGMGARQVATAYLRPGRTRLPRD